VPFNHGPFLFTQSVIDTHGEVGAVYGLFKASARPGYFDCLYVGETDNLRRRLKEHLNNPPIAGITYFFSERWDNASQRKSREMALISEFNPPGNTIGRR
jgi:hypothetical protein